MTLSNALSNRQDLSGFALHRVITDAIFPFKPGTVATWLDEVDFDDNRRTLHIQAKALKNYPFRLDVDRMMLSYPPNAFITEIYQRVFEHFRNRPSIPVEEHIQLGED